MAESFDDVVREYIDFVNQQVGMYMDALAGFAGHCARVERQTHRLNRPVQVNGNHVVYVSYEDPTQPDIIHNRIIRAEDYIKINSAGGSNEQQHACAIIVFLFTYWEDEIRPRMAKAKRVELNEIRSDIMGDLRIIRHAILHAKRIVRQDEHKRLKKLKEMISADEPIHISYDNMHQIFVLIKQSVGEMLLSYIGVTNSPVKPEDIRDICIQKSSR